MNDVVNATLIPGKYAATLFYKGSDKAPSAERAAFFSQTELQRSSKDPATGEKVVEKYNGWKRNDEKFAINYLVPAGTGAWITACIDRALHLYAKDLADSYLPIPEQLDENAFLDWITPQRSSEVDSDALAAALASLKAFVFALRNNETLASATEFIFRNGFVAKAITSQKGYNIASADVPKVLEQLRAMLIKFGESTSSEGHDDIVIYWVNKLNRVIEAENKTADVNNLFAL